jgi:hypothetical protein
MTIYDKKNKLPYMPDTISINNKLKSSYTVGQLLVSAIISSDLDLYRKVFKYSLDEIKNDITEETLLLLVNVSNPDITLEMLKLYKSIDNNWQKSDIFGIFYFQRMAKKEELLKEWFNGISEEDIYKFITGKTRTGKRNYIFLEIFSNEDGGIKLQNFKKVFPNVWKKIEENYSDLKEMKVENNKDSLVIHILSKYDELPQEMESLMLKNNNKNKSLKF